MKDNDMVNEDPRFKPALKSSRWFGLLELQKAEAKALVENLKSQFYPIEVPTMQKDNAE